MLRGGKDGCFHVEEAVVGIDAPMGADAPGDLGFCAGIADGACVLVEGRCSFARNGNNQVFGMDVEEVYTIAEASVVEGLGECQLVVPEGFGTEVGILGREHVHLAEGRVAESFGCRGFEFHGAGQVEGKPEGGDVFRTYVGMVVDADACVDGQPSAEVLAEIDVGGYFVVVLFHVVGAFAFLLAFYDFVPFFTPETVPVDACREAVAPEEPPALVGGDAHHLVVGDEAVVAGIAVVVGVDGVAVINPVVTPVVKETERPGGVGIIVFKGEGSHAPGDALVCVFEQFAE